MQESYISRMNQAIVHKRYFIDIIRELQERKNYTNILEEIFEKKGISNIKILDFGCGSGLLTSKIAEEFPNAIIHGYDRSLDMIEIARERFFGRNLQFFTKVNSLQAESYDYIILSSVLHEVYSQFGCLQTIPVFLNELKSFLKPKGYIISRDNFVSNSMSVNTIQMSFVNSGITEEASLFLDKLIESTPLILKDHFINLFIDKSTNTISGSERAVLEFLNKFTWGEESLPRESQESLFCFSPQDWKTMTPQSYNIIAQYNYVDSSYLSYLRDIVEIPENFPTHQWTILQQTL